MELNSSLKWARPTFSKTILLLSALFSTSLAQSTIVSPSSSITSQTSNTPTTLLTSISRASNIAASSSAYRPQGTDNVPNTFNAANPAGSFPSGTSAVDSNSDDTDDQRTGLLNFYFVFLALFILLLVIGVYFIHKRKRARKMAFRNSGQNALARDLDGWTSSRRWMHGHRREESRVPRREEGLNEYGEAPPPYIHPAKAAEEHRMDVGGSQIQIPLRTLSVHEYERPATGKPPGYREVVGEQNFGTIGEQASTSVTSTSNIGSRS
jgi:hypothetical protein